EFAGSAAGVGLGEYTAVRDGSNYSGGGTLWLDMVTIHGNPSEDGNFPPEIVPIPDMVAFADESPIEIPLQVGDPEGGELTFSVSASDYSVVADHAISVDSTNPVLTLWLQP